MSSQYTERALPTERLQRTLAAVAYIPLPEDEQQARAALVLDLEMELLFRQAWCQLMGRSAPNE